VSIHVGIDPGHYGALAIFVDDKPPAIHPMPLRKYNAKNVEIDAERVHDLFASYEYSGIDLAAIEQVGATPLFGSKSSFTFGKGFGMILAILAIRGIPHIRVQPKEWKKKILVGTDQSKEAAIGFVKRLYPKVSLVPPGKDKDSHDYAEAVCIGLYGKRYGK